MAKALPLTDCPAWPLGLTAAEAARYLGFGSVATFRRECPVEPRRLTERRVVYDRLALDDWFRRRQRGEAVKTDWDEAAP
jgi:hypothetical protein